MRAKGNRGRLALPRFSLKITKLLALTVWTSAADSAQRPPCEPSPAILQELEKASSTEQVIEPLRNLRLRFPNDLFVHLRYQDAIKERGVEGHLKEMFEEYLVLKIQHPDDPFYLYLFGRALEGRMTPRAISTMDEVLNLDPEFAPAHRTLAEIYGSARFRDRKKEEVERSKFGEACPGSVILPQPLPPPPPGDFTKAERLLGQNDGQEHVEDLVYQAMQQHAWRVQRIRPFDWYTAEQKQQVTLEAQSAQWRGWSLLVRHYRALKDPKADQLLSELAERFEQIHSDRHPDLFWTAATALVQLYAVEQRPEKVREALTQMEKFLAVTPNRERAAELAKFRSRFVARGGPPRRQTRVQDH